MGPLTLPQFASPKKGEQKKNHFQDLKQLPFTIKPMNSKNHYFIDSFSGYFRLFKPV
jgi:hypothetical protein